MADLRTFRGLRYAAGVDLQAAVSPPYDVLSASQAAALRTRSPYNAVHVDLPVDAGQAGRDADYERAAGLLRSWQDGGVLARESEPSIYLVDQYYAGPDGRERLRRGFIARLLLADLDERVVLPHEKTHAGPKMDRLRLLRATHTDLSQVFLLYPDEDGAATARLRAAADAIGLTAAGEAARFSGAPAEAARDAAAGSAPADAAPAGAPRWVRDADGNLHVVAPLAGDAATEVTALLNDSRLYIADGHHRYETALAYRDERRAVGDHGADTMMVYLSSMDDPGLTVFPTHRLVKGLEVPPMDEVQRRLAPVFDVSPCAGSGREACERMAAEVGGGRSAAFGLYFAREQACCTVELRDASSLEGLQREGFSPVAARLPVNILHTLILRDAMGIDASHSEGHIDYVTGAGAAFDRLASGKYVAGAFVSPTRVSDVRAIADGGEIMPQKSTYFSPKLLTGLVFDPLGD